ncbi:MAG: ankyrin repeat domain-containing protein [Boseongicola sp.]
MKFATDIIGIWRGSIGAVSVAIAFGIAALEASAAEIHEAAIGGEISKIRELLDAGANVNEADPNGTPLAWALFGRQVDAAILLLEYGADPNQRVSGPTPLEAAARLGHLELVTVMLSAGADPNVFDKQSPLGAAAKKNDTQLAELLIEYGADPDGRVSQGLTPLHIAAESGGIQVARLLVEHGANVNALTSSGRPPLHYAVQRGHVELAEEFIRAGATPGPIEPISQLLPGADPTVGKEEARTCLRCHRIDGISSARFGPHLWDVVNREIGSITDFEYSEALRNTEGIWDYERLNRFIARPTEVIPGNGMDFAGVADPSKRSNLIAYLRTLSHAPVPLPK